VRRPARRVPAPAAQGREHVVAGRRWAWDLADSPADPAPDPAAFARILDSGVRIGFERTVEQDAAFGIRQLVDVACKALSPAVNDPYTAVQAVDHLS
jgi:Predicted membrane protein